MIVTIPDISGMPISLWNVAVKNDLTLKAAVMLPKLHILPL
jgi:hypothetical protein